MTNWTEALPQAWETTLFFPQLYFSFPEEPKLQGIIWLSEAEGDPYKGLLSNHPFLFSFLSPTRFTWWKQPLLVTWFLQLAKSRATFRFWYFFCKLSSSWEGVTCNLGRQKFVSPTFCSLILAKESARIFFRVKQKPRSQDIYLYWWGC